MNECENIKHYNNTCMKNKILVINVRHKLMVVCAVQADLSLALCNYIMISHWYCHNNSYHDFKY
jgi:hypothetical protein